MNEKNPQQSLVAWVKLLKNGILISDVEDATVEALCCHLTDLGILERVEAENWKLLPNFDDSLAIEDVLKNLLNDLCETERGFALHYFLKDPPATQIKNNFPNYETAEGEGRPESNRHLLEKKTSNLSNLQIVKKYGRQVESFVELEKYYTKRLLGPHTTSKEARKIFNFILSRMKHKTEPQPWEQLSRRRHK